MSDYVTNFDINNGDGTIKNVLIRDSETYTKLNNYIKKNDSMPLIGSYVPVTQKFIREYTDPDHNGNKLIGDSTYSMAYQGMCITPSGIVSARTDTNNDSKTCWILLDTNGKFIKRSYVPAGHCNGMAYYNNAIYATYNVEGQTTVLKKFNATSWAYEKTYDNINGGNVCIDKTNGILYSLSDSLNKLYIMNLKTEVVTTKTLVRPDNVEFNQGSCFYNGYIYVLGYYTLNIFDTNGNFIGSSLIAQTDGDGLLIREIEDLDVWDNNGTFIFQSGFQMSNTGIRDKTGAAKNMYLCGAYYGLLSLKYFNQSNTKPVGNINLSRPNAVYVASDSKHAKEDAIHQDGTASYPFRSFFSASLITYGISTLSANNYTTIPDCGDCFSAQSIVARFLSPTTSLNLSAPLIFKYGTFYSDTFNITASSSNFWPLNIHNSTFNNIVVDNNNYFLEGNVVIHARTASYVNVINSHSLGHKILAYVDGDSYINPYLIGTTGGGKIWQKCKLQFNASTTFTIPLPQCWSSYSKTIHLYDASAHKMYSGCFVSVSHIVLGDHYITTSISGNNVTFNNMPTPVSQIIIS